MWLDRDRSTRWLLLMLAGTLVGLALAATVEGARGTARSSGSAVVTYLPADTVLADPVVKETPANLQAAFANEINAKERYASYARQAALEGYPAVVRVFRACADAESIHARRFVEAIAVTGGQARAVLERVAVFSTAQNLRTALRLETWEVERYYPALLERARAEHWPMAVRGMTGALATEREHVRLLSAALAGLDAPQPVAALHVCAYCGSTVEHPDPDKCPQCFTPSRRFIDVR